MKSNENIDSLLITNPTNIRYLTGFVGVAPEEREAYVLLTPHIVFLFANALYREQVKNAKCHMLNAKFESVEISRENPISKELAKLMEKFGIKKLGFEDTNLTVAELSKLKQVLTHIDLVPIRNRIEALRMIKRGDEIKHIREAAELTDECFEYILTKLTPAAKNSTGYAGITEGEIAWEIETFFRKNGAGNAFSPIVAFGKNTSQPHYQNITSQSIPMRSKDIILLDFGAKVNGYCADMTRVVFTGTPNNAWVSTYNTVLTSNRKALDLLGTGERNGATLDAAAREIITEAGLPVYPHSLGHAVGLDIHEAPRLTVKTGELLKPGMAVTVEPAVYVEGSYGVRIEDLVLITETGSELLSHAPKELTILK